MPEIEAYECQHCGRERRFADSWLIAERKDGVFSVFTSEAGLRLCGKREYYCGQACLFAAMVGHIHRSAHPPRKAPAVVGLSYTQASHAAASPS